MIGHGFMEAGVLAVSAEALNTAKAFLDEVIRIRPGEDWIVCFDWADQRRLRTPGTNEWNDLGPGFDLSVYPRRNVPSGALGSAGTLVYAVKIGAHRLADVPDRRIEIAPMSMRRTPAS